MNYIQIHEKFISYFRKTSPEQRIQKRDPHDIRLSTINIYTEMHHITPRSLGGLDVPENLVKVLPEEHIFLHELRYKAFNKREDMLAVRFVLNGFNSPTKTKSIAELKYILNKHIRKGYSFIRTQSANFRKLHGWQTENGRKRISESRKGLMPAIEKLTGLSVGTVSVNHEKIKSGEWVHHSKGYLTVLTKLGNKVRITTEEYRINKHLYTTLNSQKGNKNPRFSGLTDNDILQEAVKISKTLGVIIPYRYLVRTSKLPIPKSLSSMRFNGDKTLGYVREMKNLLPDYTYSKYFRDEKSREKSRESTLRHAKNNKGKK